ncbi:hypothetical protein CC78DRAFT_459950 [Lojkania enalia]|uniref:LTD domain-containing protein n=1 Tax=Lojkania enalia TaxID=147567 RepID=A0A9P4KDT6_9PLEO|nr:hypothetical protein CC78DRAFT_459950 [Didymosphaeria enalia]
MPIENYGVWKATPIRYTYETKEQDPKSPHLSLYYRDEEPAEGRAAINIKSGDKSDSRLVYWTVPDFHHPIIEGLADLSPGFHELEANDDLALDYIRSNLFQRQTGKLLPHDIEGENNDILDTLKPIVDRAISSKATVYLFGSAFGDGKGIHNVHMNQGSPRRWARDNGVYHDGCLIIQFDDHWEGVFLGFASQAVHTGDSGRDAGQPTPPQGYLKWADFLDVDIAPEDRETNELCDRPVLITEAMVNPKGPDNQPGVAPETVTLLNRTTSGVLLTGWSIINKSNQSQKLPDGDVLSTGSSRKFEVPNCPLSNKGGTITLLNADGLKVHGVSYTKNMARPEDAAISFN